MGSLPSAARKRPAVDAATPPLPPPLDDPNFYCPMSLCVFEDPVIILCGHTFERSFLVQDMQTKSTQTYTCPTCRAQVPKTYVPNRALWSVMANQRHTMPPQAQGIGDGVPVQRNETRPVPSAERRIVLNHSMSGPMFVVAESASAPTATEVPTLVPPRVLDPRLYEDVAPTPNPLTVHDTPDRLSPWIYVSAFAEIVHDETSSLTSGSPDVRNLWRRAFQRCYVPWSTAIGFDERPEDKAIFKRTFPIHDEFGTISGDDISQTPAMELLPQELFELLQIFGAPTLLGRTKVLNELIVHLQPDGRTWLEEYNNGSRLMLNQAAYVMLRCAVGVSADVHNKSFIDCDMNVQVLNAQFVECLFINCRWTSASEPFGMVHCVTL
jgi:hypothetical protein